jgi:ABC-type multidrug transport system permease subunit
MRKTWIFFKLRMLQLKSDKTALFFCYILPVLLLMGIGYPLQMKGDAKIVVSYSDTVHDATSAALVDYLGKHKLVKLLPYDGDAVSFQQALERDEIKHFLDVRESQPVAPDAALHVAATTRTGQPQYTVYSNSLADNRVENAALSSIVDGFLHSKALPDSSAREVPTQKYTSYLVTLLPGIIGMTLLIIGLNGFGGVLIEEEHHGLYKNIKTIDASPVAFLAGLFISRMLVSYSVAVALYLIGVLVFGIPANINYLLLTLVVTLGCIAFLGLGLVIATISPSATAFNGIVNFVQMPFIILGGVFFAVGAFPEWLQIIAKLSPLTQLNSAMRELLFDSVGFANVWKLYPEIAVLAAWSLFALVFARMKFKW